MDNIFGTRSFFVDDSNKRLINNVLKDKNDREIVKGLVGNLKVAYAEAGIYLQKYMLLILIF